MFRYLLSLFELKRARPVQTYRVFYSPIGASFYLYVLIEASTAYEAARKFDQSPEFFYARRNGMPTLA